MFLLLLFFFFGNLIFAQVNHCSQLHAIYTRSRGQIILTIICIKQSIRIPNKMKIDVGLYNYENTLLYTRMYKSPLPGKQETYYYINRVIGSRALHVYILSR